MVRSWNFLEKCRIKAQANRIAPAFPNFLRLFLVLAWLLCTCCRAPAGDYVVVVDTSGSMDGPISIKDQRSRIGVVQAALTDFFGRLPLESRVYYISFNTGITSQDEIYIRGDDDRQK